MSSGLSAAEEMALMKKLGALEVENKELKKGEQYKKRVGSSPFVRFSH